MPAVKVCGKDSLACCGFNELWDRRMTAVKSGKREKHRKYYLFNKKKKKERKRGGKKPQTQMYLLGIPHTLVGGCTGVDLTHSALRVCSQTGARVAFLLL